VNERETGTIDISDRVDESGDILDAMELGFMDGAVRLQVSGGTSALGADSRPLAGIDLQTVEEPPVPPAEYYIVGQAADLGPDGSTFDPPLSISLRYDPSLLPPGVSEEDLVISYYDEENGAWIELQCVVDVENHTVTADVGHFTLFAVMVKAASADISVRNLTLSADEIVAGEYLTVSTGVFNTGEAESTRILTLMVNGELEATEEITVAAGAGETASFTISRAIPGSYDVEIDGYASQFTVVASPPAATTWPMIGGVIAAAIAVMTAAVLISIRRRQEVPVLVKPPDSL
jgi:hypothetical protein